jgi:hypothetical protein
MSIALSDAPAATQTSVLSVAWRFQHAQQRTSFGVLSFGLIQRALAAAPARPP